MKTRVTQTDIARIAGVHNTTVSLALRNSPAIPEATRKRIQSIAEELGYCPDPALQALVAYRNGRMSNRRQETIAYVTHGTTRWGWQEVPAEAKCYAGVQRKAAQAGYHVEHFWFGEPGMTARRLGSVLFHRGITGVILASQRDECDAWRDMDWSRLSAIKLGCFPHGPAVNRVTHDQSGVIRMAMRRIAAAGYQRVGLVLPRWWDDAADRAWSAGYLAEQYRQPEENRVPLLLYGAGAAGAEPAATEVGIADFAAWYDRHQPEVIVSTAAFVRRQIGRLRLCVPRDVAYVDLSVGDADDGVAGVRENDERVGEIATELLVGQMRQNTCGLPQVATATLVDGVWVDGASLPPARASFEWSTEVPGTAAYTEKAFVAVR